MKFLSASRACEKNDGSDDSWQKQARLASAALTFVLAVLVALALSVATQGQSTPIQPVAFSHRLHAGDNAMSCQLCHPYARRSAVAGIPSVQRCAQCHLTIASAKPEVVKLLAYWERKEPIPWLRMHDLPDYVRFTHKRHVLAGIQCETCHGNVARMEAALQTAPLTMGWCVGCHRERQATTECVTCHY